MLPDAGADISQMVDRHMALAREWDALVAEVRSLPGFEDFLHPPRLAQLLPAADDGPVVILTASRRSADAILVTATGAAVAELPEVNADIVNDRAHQYVRAVQDVTDPSSESLILGTLAWLWDSIAGPVLDALRFTGPVEPGTPWSRLWWCPTGPFTVLPIHAAGYHSSNDRDQGRTVLDRVVSSYIPSLRTLADARHGTRAALSAATDERMLVITRTDAAGAAAERTLLTSLLPPDGYTLLDDADATRDAVRTGLERHQWVHFSGHADQDLTQPWLGGLKLADGVLSVADLSAGRYRGDFAFLNANMTAVGGLVLADEAISVAAALHYNGYRQVVATMGPVSDRLAKGIAAIVYTDLISDGRFRPDRAAYTLHAAVRQLRARYASPTRWLPFIHIGA